MNKCYVEVDCLHSGQVRPYSGCRYTARITFTREDFHTNAPAGSTIPWPASEQKAIDIFHMAVNNEAVKADDPKRDWASVTFTKIEQESRGVWLLDAYQEYLD